MCTDLPNSFTHCDNKICISELLPLISIEAEKAEIRHEICALIRSSSCPSYQEKASTDFEFINMIGKKASVPQCKDGFQWEVKAVKKFVGVIMLMFALQNAVIAMKEINDNAELDASSGHDLFNSSEQITNLVQTLLFS